MLIPVTKAMSRGLITIPMGTTLSEAAQVMTAKRVRHLPITDALDDIVGVISLKDISLPSSFDSVAVEWRMTTPAVAVSQDLTIRQTALKMIERKISSVLVVDENERVLGIVTTDDLLWQLAHLLNDENAKAPMLTAESLNTIGQVAQRISDLGI